MELEFIKKGNSYEAIFEVPSDFNIHIELDKPSYLGIYQSSIQDGEYSFTTEYKLNDIQKIYDIDFAALVYPKWIKVVSGSEVVSASVNFNEGGGSGNGSGSGDNVIYYKLLEPIYFDKNAANSKGYNFFSGVRGYYDKSSGYYYGTLLSVTNLIGGKYSSYGYIDALEFRPIQFTKSSSDVSIITYNDFESFAEAFPGFGVAPLSRITAEEYWEHFNAE